MFLAFAGNAIQLVPDGTLIFHLVLIILMVAILNATLLKPINKILEERDRRTRGRLTEAQTVIAQVDEKMRTYERQLREARSEGYSVLEQQRGALSADRDKKLADLKTEMGELLASEKERLGSEAQDVKRTLTADSASLAIEISQRILRRPIGSQGNA